MQDARSLLGDQPPRPTGIHLLIDERMHCYNIRASGRAPFIAFLEYACTIIA
jgi:hypothetical protein